MFSNPDSMIMLAGIRHHELQKEAANIRLIREAQGDNPPLRATIATACHQLGATLGRARQHLDDIRWTPALPQRGAFTR
jgi:hypothetical protein